MAASMPLRVFPLMLDQGEIVTLIGATGRGKSSILRAISALSLTREASSSKGDDLKADCRRYNCSQGIAPVPEGRGIFGESDRTGKPEISNMAEKDKNKHVPRL